MNSRNSWPTRLTLTGLLVVFLAIFTGSSPALDQQAPPLFAKAPSASELSVTVERSPTVVRSRHVLVNFDYLAGKDLPEGADAITLNLFDDFSVTAVKDHMEKRSEIRYTWFGRVAGVEESQIIIVVKKESMVANITIGERVYQVRPVGDGAHAVHEIDPSAFPEGAPPIPIESPNIPSYAQEIGALDSADTIDVLVVYTADAAQASSDIAAEIRLAIDETNATYANSGITQRLRLVHAAELTYTESGNMGTDLERLQNPFDGYMDDVHTLRDDHCADLVSLWIENEGPYSGIGYLMSSVSNAFASYAFSVVGRGYATGSYAFGHELGHNMAARHDWYVDPTDNSPYGCNHGYVDTGARWRTMMAYSKECSDAGFYCRQIPYWSNPDVTYEGNPTGIPEDAYHGSDNRKTLNSTASTVANFRASCWEPTSCIGDFDNDGDVDVSDLSVFAGHFGRTDCDQRGRCKGDFDVDGDVDASDWAVFATDFESSDCLQ